MGGRLDVRVALLTDDIIDVVQTIGRDARKGPGAVWGKVAIGAPRASKICRTLDDHSCRSEGLRRKKREREKRIADIFKIICTCWPVIKRADWKWTHHPISLICSVSFGFYSDSIPFHPFSLPLSLTALFCTFTLRLGCLVSCGGEGVGWSIQSKWLLNKDFPRAN